MMTTLGSGLMSASPPRPGQHRIHWEGGRPDQPAEQSAHLGHRHRYQPFLPFEAAPFLPDPPWAA